MKILFITRNFPPQKGGLETTAFWLVYSLRKKEQVILLKWGGCRKLLLLCFPYFLCIASLFILRGSCDIIYLHDGMLAPLGLILKIFRKPAVITIHGLDITYKNKLYQFVVPACVSRLDSIICISEATKKECLARNIPERKIHLIPDGFNDCYYIHNADKETLKKEADRKFGLNIGNNKIIFSVSRLVERKGIHWFVDEVIPLLKESHENFLYLIAGEGGMRDKIEESIRIKKIGKWVKLLGKLSEADLKLFFNISDIFVMPNLPLKGDIEGFGVAALEAASCKVVVVASNLEGIKDALLNGEAGILVPSLNAVNFKNELLTLIENDELRVILGNNVRNSVLAHFLWEDIALKYLDVLKGHLEPFIAKNNFSG
ncbi:MAG: glycosyltransferase family 4 protein [Candidatus Omnitrophica bacterium]|nr:glycosyltransferase family 4 protein [Candidatus Omnitrophota bacterium]